MERAAKIVTLVSTLAAVGLASWFVSDGWWLVWPLTLAAFFGAAGVALFADEAAAAFAMVFAYIFPAAIILTYGRFFAEYSVIWMAAVLGALAPRSVRARWGIPRRWRAPLVLWALTVAAAWPIVVLREIDFVPATLSEPRLASSIGGGFPQEAAVTVLNAAAMLGIGILWFDWLFLRFGGDVARFRRWIPPALAASWLVAITVSGYQLFWNLEFLTIGIFAAVGRATATMGDANAFGMVAAVSGAVVVAWLLRWSDTRKWLLVVAAVAFSWIGVWASGSRTAFVAGIVILVSLVWSAKPQSVDGPAVSRTRLVGVIAMIILVGLGIFSRLPAIGPVVRLRESLPSPTAASASAFVKEMWNRNNYGAVATVMIREHPLVGVGIGGFSVLLPDYSRVVGSPFLIPRDNAQNWYRHQLAEFGLLGSIGWVAWTVMFGWFVLVSAASPGDRLSLGVLKGALVALALVSLVGMPTQNSAVAITLWTIAYWVSALSSQGQAPARSDEAPLGRAVLAWIIAVLCVFIGGTAYAARHDLRVASRAVGANWPYSYGFYAPESASDGREFRWARQRAVTVLAAANRWIRVTVSANHPDLSTKPVAVRVWLGESLAASTTLRTSAPVVAYARVPEERQRVVLETWVSRVFRPRDFGGNDPRDLGLMVQWEFVERPPAAP